LVDQQGTRLWDVRVAARWGPGNGFGGMNTADVIQVLRDALWVTAIVSGPFLIIGMVIGLFISLIQAMTQLQEATLTFVPKVVVLGLLIVVFGPFAINRLIEFTQELMDRAIALGIQ
jgi:flagellar biosynthetic protein FliQ